MSSANVVAVCAGSVIDVDPHMFFKGDKAGVATGAWIYLPAVFTIVMF